MHRPQHLKHAVLIAAFASAGTAGCAVSAGDFDVRGGAGHARASCALPADDARWIAAAAPTEQGELAAWCAAVGPAVLRVPSAQSADTAIDSLVVVTWNTHVGGGDIVAFVDDLRAGQWTGGRPVTHFVLLLQEVHRAGPAVPTALPAGARGAARITHDGARERPDVVEIANRLGLALWYVPSMRNGLAGDESGEDRGNAVLATLPLSDVAAIELPLEAQRRVATTATVRAMDGAGRAWALQVTSLHLDNRSRLARGLATFGSARTRQARALVAALAAEREAVVGGDLNTWSFDALEDAPHVLRRAFPDAPPQTEPTFVAAGVLPRRLDHLYFRTDTGGMSAPVRVDARYGSDHHPVLAWVAPGAVDAARTAAR